MNKINPKKLLNSKWTAVKPVNKEKHFIIVAVEYDGNASVLECVIEAVISKRQRSFEWRDLNDKAVWLSGWT
ncbi:MAG: TIGR02450 family Trp-rich protein [Arenicella sp.]|nr:TIGR02450 family Trp-rich protein [Arenicella sp.]